MKHIRLAAVVVTTALTFATPGLAQTTLGQSYNAFVGGFVDSVDGDRDPAYGPFSRGGAAGPNFQAESAVGSSWSVSALSDDTGGGRVQAQANLGLFKPGMQTYAKELLGQAAIDYAFKIDGTDQDPLIPVLLLGNGGVSVSTSGGIGQAGLDFTHDGITDNFGVQVFSGGPGAGFTVNQIYKLQPGHVYYLGMFATAHAFAALTNGESGVASVNASVDPTFTILGGYGSRYHFVGLPSSATGSGTAPAVPEPETWAMMVGGFGVIGSVMRRRRRRQVRILPA